jgi:SAM-dependent methyltransferase
LTGQAAMAIEALYLHILRQAIERRQAVNPRVQALFLAYPDLLVPRAVLARWLGEEALGRIPVRSDAAAIWAYHGLKGVAEPLYDSMEMFRMLGLVPEVIDVARVRGMERIVDLNEPLPHDLARRFDLVVDTGTCEHCFNVGRAFMNACEALDAGGLLVHAAPLNRANHGFWSFNPTVYPDFFEDNGFRIHTLTGVAGNLVDGMRPFAVDPFARFDAPAGAALYVVAERVEVRDLKWPVQRKYRGVIP